MMYKLYLPTCRCGAPEGVRIVLNNYAHVGLTTTSPEGENFKNNRPLSVENLYCPQCGAPRRVIVPDQEVDGGDKDVC